MSKIFQPIIKWSGSKRSQCRDIISFFPNEIETYYEPFCGGASVMRAVIEEPTINVNHYVISDYNEELIKLWNVIKNNPDNLFNSYKLLWTELNRDGATIEYQKEFYNNIRSLFNEFHNPTDFFFLLRTCYNGMIRYNSNGEFNTPFHLNRPGINPDKLQKILFEWSELLNDNNIHFQCCDYQEIQPNINDFLYLDPPYANTNGLYSGGLDLNEFYNYLRNLKCNYILSFDGISGDEDNTVALPQELYTQHIYLNSGNSSFKRLIESDKQAQVFESLYIKKQIN